MSVVSPPRRLLLSLTCALCAAWAGATAAPRPPPPQAPVIPRPALSAPPPAVAAESDDAQVLLPELKGLWLLGNASSVVHDGGTQPGVTIRGLPLIDTWSARAALGVFLGKPLTRGSLYHQVQAEFLRAMKASGRLPISSDRVDEARRTFLAEGGSA